ncbi:hypothetical protein [Klebsiella quasipneumoniae]|uniref:hypothetical protein n=1 Tax=Klebsiella quasipneumoniae TaxID=1463165 RepID=UPI0029494454|nr:hypothetical protein [Klebsiella quasipneumoniae]EIX9043889.1 hypothetical protein [Klebsiella variicola]MDV5693360.1 hypothetical protein [Klebsiella quasipneumoniae]
MSEEVVESFKTAVKERLNGVFFGYFILSWITFNWSILAYFFMSKKTIEERISHAMDLLNIADYFYYPLLLSLSLSILTPYINTAIKWSHYYALVLLEKLNVYVNSIHEIELEKNKQKITDINIQGLIKIKNEEKLTKELEDALTTIRNKNKLSSSYETLQNEFIELQKEKNNLESIVLDMKSQRAKLESELRLSDDLSRLNSGLSQTIQEKTESINRIKNINESLKRNILNIEEIVIAEGIENNQLKDIFYSVHNNYF